MKRGRPDQQLCATFHNNILVRLYAEDMLWLTDMYSVFCFLLANILAVLSTPHLLCSVRAHYPAHLCQD